MAITEPTEIPLRGLTWQIRRAGDRFLMVTTPVTFAGLDLMVEDIHEPLPCAICGYGYDKEQLGVVVLPGGEYENKWYLGVRGSVAIHAVGCRWCGGISGIAIGEHKGALRVAYVYTTDVVLPGPLLKDEDDDDDSVE